jgi:hypothetical protein
MLFLWLLIFGLAEPTAGDGPHSFGADVIARSAPSAPAAPALSSAKLARGWLLARILHPGMPFAQWDGLVKGMRVTGGIWPVCGGGSLYYFCDYGLSIESDPEGRISGVKFSLSVPDMVAPEPIGRAVEELGWTPSDCDAESRSLGPLTPDLLLSDRESGDRLEYRAPDYGRPLLGTLISANLPRARRASPDLPWFPRLAARTK